MTLIPACTKWPVSELRRAQRCSPKAHPEYHVGEVAIGLTKNRGVSAQFWWSWSRTLLQARLCLRNFYTAGHEKGIHPPSETLLTRLAVGITTIICQRRNSAAQFF